MKENSILEMRGISRSFLSVKALQNVDFTLCRGEIMALMGENGAGKSTLIKILTGVYTKDSGEIYLKGHSGPVEISSPQQAQELGISTVYQEIPLCPNLSVAENIYAGRHKKRLISWRKLNEKAEKLLSSLGIPASPVQPLGSCSVAVQQMIAIARAVDMECSILVLDEPTSSLDEQETERLFELMRQLRSKGTGMIFVTHFLDQVYDICDRVTVLRDGRLTGVYNVSDISRVQLVAEMLGRELDDSPVAAEAEDKAVGEVLYHGRNIHSSENIAPFELTVRKGEISGFAGLLGSGRSECVRAVFGADKGTGGNVVMNGKTVSIRKPSDAIKNGIAYLSEDRKAEGIIGELSVRENIILALQVKKGFFRPFSKSEAEGFADEYIRALGIKTASADTPVKELSGGNQQKVILARWLLTHPEYLILDEPTRGIDIGAKADIQRLVKKLADDGMSVTFISSELGEMLGICSRLFVMRDRKMVGQLSGRQLSEDNIMKTIAGGEHDGAGPQ
ncbi:MAG: sugar ABC transporter ATP-binding protein [Ruminococcus sp.]|nr:sugar ABC transporter ATP-binding protein [Ruminococcus sp.]